MNYKALTISKLNNALNEIRLLKNRRYPCQSSKNALILLDKYFVEQLRLITLYSEGNALKNFCSQVQTELAAYMAIIGLIANSANIRNVFEAYEPLWRVASKILEPSKSPRSANINLIISSEWKFSPFVFSGLWASPVLKDFIPIGLPASEAANPLLIPLAGHELGHIVWKRSSLRKTFEGQVKKILTGLLKPKGSNLQLSLFDTAEYPEMTELSLKQAEETFCDLFGLRLFRQSYIYAFFYLLFPWKETYSSSGYTYPPIVERINMLMQASKVYGITFPSDHIVYDDIHSCCDSQCEILCTIRRELLPALIDKVSEIIPANKKGSVEISGDEQEVERIAKKIRKIVPATNIKTFSDIVNAGWLVYIEKENGGVADDRFTTPALMDVIIKNYEIFALEQRLLN